MVKISPSKAMDLDAIREEYDRILRSDNVRQMDLDFRWIARHIPGLLAELSRFRVPCVICRDRFLPAEKENTCSECQGGSDGGN